MLFKRFAIIVLIVLIPVVGRAGDITPQEINDVLRAAEELQETMQVVIPDNREANAAAEEAARDFNSPETQSRICDETNRLTETIFAEHLQDSPEIKEHDSLKDGSGRIYLFISSSMPLQTLKNYAADIDSLAPQDITMVLRGFVGGMKLFAPTRDFITEILEKDPACDPNSEQCEVFKVSVEIHPELFDELKITEVPALAYVRDENRTFVVHGDISLAGGLEKIQDSARSAYLEQTIKKLKGGYYDYQ